MASTSKYQQQLGSALNSFYQQPVARVSIELFLSIGLILFLSIFAIRPTLITMSDLIKEIDDKKIHSENLDKKITALATAQSEYISFEDKLVYLDQAISSKPELVYSLKVLEKLASDNNVVISGMTVSELPTEESEGLQFSNRVLNTMPISINLVGDYVSIRNYTEAIRSNRHAYTIESVSFNLNDDEAVKTLTASLTTSVPYYGPPMKGANDGLNTTGATDDLDLE